MVGTQGAIFHTCVCVCVFQTVQSEQPLSDEGGAKVNISSAVLEDSLRINETAEGLCVCFYSQFEFVHEKPGN